MFLDDGLTNPFSFLEKSINMSAAGRNEVNDEIQLHPVNFLLFLSKQLGSSHND